MINISRYFLYCFFIIAVLLPFCITQDQAIPTARSFQVGQNIIARATDGRVMTIIAVKELKSKYFFIHVQLDQQSRNFPLKLFIYNQGVTSPIKVCEPAEIDACYLSKQQMKQNNNILLLTDSPQHNYGLTIRSYWSDLQHLKPNSSIKFFFSQQDQSQLYHLELDNTNFHELRIVLKPQTIRSAFDKIKIYGKFGHNNTPSQSDYDFKSIHLWQDAQGVFLYGKQVTDKNMNILVIGQIQTIYTLSCQIIKQQHHELQLGEILHEYLEPGEDFMYHGDFYKSKGKNITNLQFEEYVVVFSGFSGKLSLGFYLDNQKRQSLDIQPFQYLSDAQYVFKRQQIQTKLKNGLYIYVHALQRKSVFSINFYGRNKTIAVKLNQNIHQFIQTDPHIPVLTYFQIYHWANDTDRSKFQYSVALTNVVGEQQLQFRTCNANLQDCVHINRYQKQSQLHDALVTTIGTKQTFLLEFTRESLQKINHAEDIITVLVVVKNKKAVNGNGFAAIQYRSQNRVYFLRQGKPLQTRIKQSQYKIFKYTNQDRFLKQIKIYVSQIAGKVEVYSLRQQPTATNKYGKQQTSSVIVFNKDLSTKPIYLVVQGMQDSIFSVQIVVVHKSDQSVSTLTLTEDLQFSIRIKPQGNQVVQVVPIHEAIYFQYKSSGSILVCGVDPVTNDCQGDYKPKLNRTGNIDIEKYKGRSKLFKLMNPSQFDIIQVTVVYHSNDMVHCEQRQINKLYYEAIQKDQISQGGFQNNCYTFPLTTIKGLSLTLSRIDLGQLHYAVAICNSLLKTQSQLNGDQLKIPVDKIRSDCKDTNQKTITLMISPHKTDDQKNKVVIPSKIKYLLEYLDDKVITIPDGVAYDFEARTTQLPVKIFYYDMINKKDTTIKLIQYTGYGVFTIQVVPTGKKQSYLNLSTHDYDFSKSDSYFLNPTLTISQQQINKKNCTQCSLIIKVFSMQQIGIKVHFGLQVIQNHKQLQDHNPVDGYLPKGSIDFYSYTTVDSKISGSLIIQVNDFNRNCMMIYLSDSDYPDQKNYIVKEEGNQLVYHDALPQENYYVALQAIQDCPYSVTASNTKVPITKLKRGFSSTLSLKAGQVKYFLIEHLQKKQFRILSILKNGQTYIYMNLTTSRDLQKLLQKQQTKIDYKKFQVKSDYANRLVLHENNSYLTQNSLYIVAVQGISQTQGYLFYGDSNTNLQIISDTFVNDQLTVAGQVFRGQYYGQGSVTLDVNVLVGQVNVKVDTHEFKDFQNQSQFDKNFTQNKITYVNQFQIQTSKESFFLRDPVEVTFTALKPSTVYSFRFVRHQSPKQENNNQTSQKTTNQSTKTQNSSKSSAPLNIKIQPGQPNFVILNANSTSMTSIQGILTHGEQLFISSPVDQKDWLNRLTIKALINDKQVELQKSIVRNIMKVKISGLDDSKSNYKLQLKSDQNLNLSIYQDYGVSLLTPDTQVLVQGTKDYVFYPENSVLLDLFECQDKATILYSRSRTDLDKLQAKTLDLIGMPGQPHAIKILNPSATFVRIQSKRSYFRWLPIDPQKGKGLGYLDYDIGSITYSGSLLQLTVQWDPVYAKRQTNTHIFSVNYVLIVGTNISNIKEAINCQNHHDTNLLYYQYSNGAAKSGQKLQVSLSKSQIVSKYSENQNLFIGIIAQAVLKLPNQKQQKYEHYRFVYATQQVPLQVFKQYEVTSKDIWIIALVAAGSIFLLALTCCICIKKVAPIISRLRQGNNMVEQKGDDKQFDVIPPSSDRNQVKNTLETEQQMK